ncbi:MAG: alternative oxidase [Candidatus Moranbacteria bacterium]|nr:alternative oxidase [Candidatus Moranbacteria bacterium]
MTPSHTDSPESTLLHYEPQCFSDWVAFVLVRVSRLIADAFFAKRYGPRAVVLETIAAVPGAVGSLFLHLKSLRRIQDDQGFIRQLQEEAENERMHLMAYVLLAKPSFFERLLIIIAQGIFCLGYTLIYFISPKTGHRTVGYLEEEAVKSYTSFLDEIRSERHPNPPAPAFAISYWKLAPEARLYDMVVATRADEIRHRNANHDLAHAITTL